MAPMILACAVFAAPGDWDLRRDVAFRAHEAARLRSHMLVIEECRARAVLDPIGEDILSVDEANQHD